ncbi:MAG: DMT family transporter [Gammaproteobacteria bacterium]
MTRYQNNNLLGIGLMLLAMLLFSVMDAAAKWLVSNEMSAIQVIAVRSWFIVAIIPPLLMLRGELSELATRKPWQHLLRGMVGVIAPLSFFSALETLPLADATVVFFSATFILTAASALLLKEHVGIHRWSAVAIGFAGVVIATNPGGGGPLLSYLLVLCATTIYALIFITGKQLSRQDSVISLVFSLHLGIGIVATAALPWVWVPIAATALAQLFLMALIALVAHYVFAAAFARAEVSALAPFEYSALVWAVLIGYAVWGDIPALEVWLGAAVIIGCGLYVIHRESLQRKSTAPAPDHSDPLP